MFLQGTPLPRGYLNVFCRPMVRPLNQMQVQGFWEGALADDYR